MKHYTRKEIYSEIRDPQPQYIFLEGNFWEYVRFYLIATLSMPWYGYIVIVAVLAGIVIIGDWIVALIACGLFMLIIFGQALYSAFNIRKLVDIGACVGFDADGVGYWVPTGEQDEDGNDTMKFAVGSPWYELNEFLVFDSFMAFRFVKTSELGLVFVPLNPEEDNNDKLENILAFWKQRAHEKPVGQKDRRLIWFIIFIALCALKFILKYLKEVY